MITNNNVYTIKQVSSGRFLDAYTAGNDFAAVTRPGVININDTTKAWRFTQVGIVLKLQQESSGRFLDAFQSEQNDFAVVTRPAQNNDTQLWLHIPVGFFTCRLRQLSTGRYLDAFQSSEQDFGAVTRPFQPNETQIWQRSFLSAVYKQESSDRFLDAYQSATNDFAAMTRTAGGDSTQRWIAHHVGRIYTIQQVSGDRFLDAYTLDNDFAAVTREEQPDDDTQQWIAIESPAEVDSLLPNSLAADIPNHIYRLRQVRNGRYLDAYQSAEDDFAAVTRQEQDNDTQRWDIRPYNPEP